MKVTLQQNCWNGFKPIEIEFHISFHKGMNPYVGLENYVSWENCGVGRGTKLTEKEYLKLKDDEKAACSKFTVNGEDFYFKPGKLARNFINRHNGDVIPVSLFFTSRLFTNEVLVELDETVIKPLFKYPDTELELSEMELNELYTEEDGEDEADSIFE